MTSLTYVSKLNLSCKKKALFNWRCHPQILVGPDWLLFAEIAQSWSSAWRLVTGGWRTQECGIDSFRIALEWRSCSWNKLANFQRRCVTANIIVEFSGLLIPWCFLAVSMGINKKNQPNLEFCSNQGLKIFVSIIRLLYWSSQNHSNRETGTGTAMY